MKRAFLIALQFYPTTSIKTSYIIESPLNLPQCKYAFISLKNFIFALTFRWQLACICVRHFRYECMRTTIGVREFRPLPRRSVPAYTQTNWRGNMHRPHPFFLSLYLWMCYGEHSLTYLRFITHVFSPRFISLSLYTRLDGICVDMRRKLKRKNVIYILQWGIDPQFICAF